MSESVCPNCGYCKECGRAYHTHPIPAVYPVWPVHPHNPYYYPTWDVTTGYISPSSGSTSENKS